jgi:hypothetical protein
MHMTGAPGVGLDESTRVGRALGSALLAIPGVRSVTQIAGRGNLSEDTWGAERSELMIRLDEDADPARIASALRERTSAVAGFTFDLKQYLNERIDELLAGSGAAIVVRVHGNELAELERAARALEERLQAVPGAVDVRTEALLGAPGLRVQPRLPRLRAEACRRQRSRALRAGLGGLPVARVIGRADGRPPLASTATSHTTPAPLHFQRSVWKNGRVVPLSGRGVVTATQRGDTRGGVRTLTLRLDASGALAEVPPASSEIVATAALPPRDGAGSESTPRRWPPETASQAAAFWRRRCRRRPSVDFGSPRLVGIALINIPALVGGVVAVVLARRAACHRRRRGFVTVFEPRAQRHRLIATSRTSGTDRAGCSMRRG